MPVKRKRRAVRRSDPPSRTPDGARPWDKLKNHDPRLKYCYVDPGSREWGVSFYEAMGWQQVLRTEGGVRPVVDGKGDSGSVITVMHQILMCIPWKQEDAEEMGFTTSWEQITAPGQAHCDQLDRKMLRTGGVDGLRGEGRLSGVVRIHNEIARNEVIHG